jgi:RNA polymerase sigma-70 factor (ECF subfamily)
MQQFRWSSSRLRRILNEIEVMNWTLADAEALFLACADNADPGAWQEFVRRYGELISRTALRVARRWADFHPEVIEDLIQETYVKLCQSQGKVLRSWRALRTDADYGFIKVFTANVVVDHFRNLNALRRNAGATVPLASVPEPATELDGLDRAMIIRDVEECLDQKATGPTRNRDHYVFALYYKHGLTAQAISQIPGIGLTREGVESLLWRLTRMLREHFLVIPRKGVRNG